jgi:hypothetical protein
VAEAVELSAAVGEPGVDWDQGDIVAGVYFAAVDTDLPGVLVTPACDIEQGKVDLWTFVALFPDVAVARALVAKDIEGWMKPGATSSSAGSGLSTKQRAALAKKMDELLNHRFARYHWLPVRIGDSPAHVADFSYVTALPADEVKERTRVASLRSSWREQLPARYASFMARVGTVDFKREDVATEVERLVQVLSAGS